MGVAKSRQEERKGHAVASLSAEPWASVTDSQVGPGDHGRLQALSQLPSGAGAGGPAAASPCWGRVSVRKRSGDLMTLATLVHIPCPLSGGTNGWETMTSPSSLPFRSAWPGAWRSCRLPPLALQQRFSSLSLPPPRPPCLLCLKKLPLTPFYPHQGPI